MDLPPTTLKKLHSFLVAAEAACSKGDLPVAAVEAMLVAVIGLATAAVATVVPAELAAVVPVALMAAIGATHPCRVNNPKKLNRQAQHRSWAFKKDLLNFADDIKYTGCP